MDCSTLGFPVHHQLLELAQTHIQRVSDASQPSHPLSSPSLCSQDASKDMHKNFHHSIIHSAPKLEDIQMSVNH